MKIRIKLDFKIMKLIFYNQKESICPSLYGMYVVRLAVSLVLTGGISRKELDTGIKTRGLIFLIFFM